MSVIEIRDLSMDYGNGIVFKDVNLCVEKGEAIVIIGGSGCGKSTMLRCINKLITPTAGEVLINGRNILAPDADIRDIRSKMGMVYQSFNLFSHLTVLENVILAPIKVLKTPREAAIDEAKKLLDKVGMLSQKDKMPSALSGGQKQRAAIARALAMHPEMILFDEPTSALDPTMVDEVESVIRDLVNDGMTSIIVTHEMSFARNIASRVVFLAEKGIYETGTPDNIFDHPKKPLKQKFIFRSRILEKELLRDGLDGYGVESELRKFIGQYSHNARQIELISVVFDELIYPIFEHGIKQINLKLMCSRDSEEHILMLHICGAATDPLDAPYTDAFNIKLLEHHSRFVFSQRNAGEGYDICIQM